MSADAGPAWSAWSRVTPVIVARDARAKYVRVVLPVTIDPGPDGRYPDLRVFGAGGKEVPYALDPARPAASERSVQVIDTGFVPHRGTQAVVDLGTSGALVDAVALDVDTDRRPTYFERVAVDASDDRRTWRIVREDAIVYRVAQDGGRGNATLTFPPTRSRWLRVRVLDPAAAFPLTGARVAAGASREPSFVRLPLAPRENDDAVKHEQVWTFETTTPVRASVVSFADGGALYERSATVETSDDGTQWSEAGSATIAHYAEGGALTNVPVEETTARRLRVTVHNGNDAPVRALRPALLARPHAVVFAAHEEPYALLSGNPRVDGPPSYDLGARLAHEDWRADGARAGETVANAGYRDPRPIGERFPWLLTGALILVAVVLGAGALRVLRSSAERPATDPE
ncbi:MAG TPA: DUF3999 family protein [Candidatus Elarobacter sp.]|nr:DUF3999 family protein [Candidatus Elarobacter sp.]